MDFAAKIIIVAVAVIVFVAVFRETWQDLRQREREYDVFEENRVKRQVRFDQHARAVAKRELIDTWASISVGRWQS